MIGACFIGDIDLKKIIKVFLVIVLLGVFIYCLYNIINYLNNSKKNEKLTDELKNIAVKEVLQDNKIEDNEIKSSTPIEIDFNKLKNINNNINAWIYMENSVINYPVVKGNDNSFYLNHNVNGEYNPNGTLFVDSRNKNNFEDMVTYIYGHHMKNNTMFGNLELFKEQNYYDNHKEMYLFTKEKNYKLELFAGFTVADGSKIYNYIDTKSNEEIVQYAKEKSNFKSNIEILHEDKIVVLSTCSYDYENARYVLLGVLKEIQ